MFLKMVQLTSTCVFLLVCFPFLTTAFFKPSQWPRVTKRLLHEDRGSSTTGNRRKLFFKAPTFRTVTVAARHDSIVLDCEAGGSPTPTIHWLKDGERIIQGNFESLEDDVPALEDRETDPDEAGEKLRLSSTKSRLYLDCLTSASEGEYTCVAETPFMRKTQSTIVKVSGHSASSSFDSCVVKRSARGEPARVYMWTVSRLEYESSTVQLFCRASGTPEPGITWYDHANNTIENSQQYSIAINGDLLIRDITWFNNMGEYRCSAENEFGSQSVETFLYPTPREDRFVIPE